MDNLKRLCDNVLQKIRDHYGKVVSVSSGYRSPELCVKIGSSMKSQHAKQAADFEIFGIANAELAKWITENIDFDQLILNTTIQKNLIVGGFIVLIKILKTIENRY